MNLLETAIAFALDVHQGQLDRAGQPYILHPLHLMCQMDTEDERLVALLHDTIEDSDRTLAELQALGLPAHVLEAIDLLTHDKQAMSYEAYVARLQPNPLARKVKLADLRHNMDLRRLPQITANDAARLDKYRQAWEQLTRRS